MDIIVSSNLHIFGDIFGSTIFKDIPCKHFKNILLSLGLSCKTFLKVYNRRFRPGRIDIEGWNIFRWWEVENRLKKGIAESQDPFRKMAFYGFNYKDLKNFIPNDIRLDDFSLFPGLKCVFIKHYTRKVGDNLKLICRDLNNLCGKEIVKNCGYLCEYDDLVGKLLRKMYGKSFMEFDLDVNKKIWYEFKNTNWHMHSGEGYRQLIGRAIREPINLNNLDFDGDEDNIINNDNIILEPIQSKQKKYYDDKKNRYRHVTSKNIKFHGYTKNLKFQNQHKRVFQPIKGRK